MEQRLEAHGGGLCDADDGPSNLPQNLLIASSCVALLADRKLKKVLSRGCTVIHRIWWYIVALMLDGLASVVGGGLSVDFQISRKAGFFFYFSIDLAIADKLLFIFPQQTRKAT